MATDPTAIFIQDDTRRWIFPLRTSGYFAAKGADVIRKHITDTILDKSTEEGFLPATLSFARKDEYHLRRVLTLDPISAFFLYDFVADNQLALSRGVDGGHRYGPGFRAGAAINAFQDYHQFRRAKYSLFKIENSYCHADIFNCFNSFYHHDVASYTIDKVGLRPGENLGRFLRESNVGHSIACFPQGIYPAKVIGNAYLEFIENSSQIRTSNIIRYLDDVVFIAQSQRACADMLLRLQHILDDKHLALNDAKTKIGDTHDVQREHQLDSIKIRLMRKRETIKVSGAEAETEAEENDSQTLEDDERGYLWDLIRDRNVAQEDIELALSLLAAEPETIEVLLDPILERAPHLLRQFHAFVREHSNLRIVWEAISTHLASGVDLAEFDLFWISRILIDCFHFDRDIADTLIKIYEDKNSTSVVRSAILETSYLDFGFDDLKRNVLRGTSTLLEMSSAMVGMSGLERGARNQSYKYLKTYGPHHAMMCGLALQF